MGVVLIFAGDHRQFVEWVSHRQRSGAASAPPREILFEEQLRGVSPDEVDGVFLVGTYTDNRAWDSDAYRYLMAEGAELGKSWARNEAEDWQRIRNAPTPEAMAEARAGLQQLERELEDG